MIHIVIFLEIIIVESQKKFLLSVPRNYLKKELIPGINGA